MLRVPLLFRGVAVLLLAAATVAGQTPEPPAELLTLDTGVPSAPDFLRQFSSDSRHPLLSLMVDGELTAFETAAPPQASKINHPPKESAAASKTAADEECVLEGGLFEGGSLGNECTTVSNCFPYACPPPPCCCRKCQRQRNRCQPRCGRHCCGQGGGYGNPYLDWPTCPAWCYYGAPLEPGSYGCCGRGCCHKRCRKHQNCGNQYGCGCGMGYGGYMDCDFCGGCMPPPQQNSCRKCQRKQRCCGGNGYGCGYASVMAACCCEGMNSYGGCGKQRCRRGLFQRCHQQQQQQPCPYFCCPMMTTCTGMGMGMGGGSFGADWADEADFGQDALVLDSGN